MKRLSVEKNASPDVEDQGRDAEQERKYRELLAHYGIEAKTGILHAGEFKPLLVAESGNFFKAISGYCETMKFKKRMRFLLEFDPDYPYSLICIPKMCNQREIVSWKRYPASSG